MLNSLLKYIFTMQLLFNHRVSYENNNVCTLKMLNAFTITFEEKLKEMWNIALKY